MIASRSRLVMPDSDQVVGARDEVVEAVLLGPQPTRVVPLLAVLAAAADVGDDHHATAFQPEQGLGDELRHQRDRVAAVRRQQRRRGTVPRSPGRGDDVERDTRAVQRLARTRGSPRSPRGRRGWSSAGPSAAAPPRRLRPTRSPARRTTLPTRRAVVSELAQRVRVRRHGAHRRDLRRRQLMALQVESAQLLRAAVHVGDPDRPPGDDEVLDDDLARRHDLGGVGDGAPSVSGSRRIFPCGARCRDSRYTASSPSTAYGQLSGMSASNHQSPPGDASWSWRRRKICHSPPSPFCTRSISHRPSADADSTCSAMPSSAMPLGTSRRSGPPPRSRNHTCCWKPAGSAHRVNQNPRTVGTPGHRAAHQVDMRDRLVDHLAAGDVEDVQRPVLGPVLRQRDGQPGAVGGSDEPVDRGLARRVDGLGIHDDALGLRVVEARECDQERALPRGLVLQREVRASGRGEAAVGRALGAEQPVDAGPQPVSPGQGVEVRAGQLPLRLRPCDGLCGGGVLQPAVVLGDVQPVVAGRDRDAVVSMLGCVPMRSVNNRGPRSSIARMPGQERTLSGTRCRRCPELRGGQSGASTTRSFGEHRPHDVRDRLPDQHALGQPPRIVRITPWGASAAPETMETCPRSRVLRSGCWSSTTRTRSGVRCRPSWTRPRASPSSGLSRRVRSRSRRRPSSSRTWC